MPDRCVATRELATLLGVLAHPERIRIVEELRDGELDVASLQKLLEVAHSRVSQNLGILRSHRIVAERREGRHVFYRLVQPGLAGWLREALKFLEREAALNDEMRSALTLAREQWSQPAPGRTDVPAAAMQPVSPPSAATDEAGHAAAHDLG
jgi:DNA-binding transcriptional ArsR family regulator